MNSHVMVRRVGLAVMICGREATIRWNRAILRSLCMVAAVGMAGWSVDGMGSLLRTIVATRCS